MYTDQYRGPYEEICLERLRMLGGFFSIRQRLALLDIGCGGGAFADLFLKAYPEASACCLDFSERMLRSNTQSPRKHLMLASARAIPLKPGVFDLINLDAIMHHMIEPGGYKSTIEGIRRLLVELKPLLAANGLIAIREIYHESYVIDNLGARFLFALSTAKLPSVCASALAAAGLNTVGSGVCFLTKSQWANIIDDAGYCARVLTVKPWGSSLKMKACGFRGSGYLYYIISPSRGI
jgi:SAM-dependent methyltransferase